MIVAVIPSANHASFGSDDTSCSGNTAIDRMGGTLAVPRASFHAASPAMAHLCGCEFEHASRRDVTEVQATVIHELLRSLGAGENHPRRARLTTEFGNCAASGAAFPPALAVGATTAPGRHFFRLTV
jgi:hypothetical protein